MLEPRESDVPTLFAILVILPLVLYFLLGKWSDSTKKKTRASELAAQLAAEESSRFSEPIPSMPVYIPAPVPMPQIHVAPVPVAPVSRGNSGFYYECATCFAPATTRCSRCKSVRYCSGKCQIVHWRQGHKDRCQPYNASGNGQVSAPHCMPDLANLNSPLHSENEQISEEANNKYEKKSTSSKSKQINFKNEDEFEISSQSTEESSKNQESGTISKNTLQNNKTAKEVRKRNKQTESPSPMKPNQEKNLDPVDRGISEKSSLKGGSVYKKLPYNANSVYVVQKPQDSRVVKEHYFEGDERNLLCKKNESRSTHANGSSNNISNEVSKKSEISKKTSKFLKCNLVGLINDNKKNKVSQVLFPYEELVKFFQYEVRGVSPRGLVNCGNSCYANAVLQCLTSTKPLMVYLLKKLHSENCCAKNWCLMCELEKHASILRANGGPLSLSKILNNMRNIDFRLGGGSQEDAHEFLRLLVMSMQSTCLESLGGEKSVDPKLQETTLIQQIFGGRLKSKVKCMRCYHESERYENIMDLTLEIHGWVESLEDALTQFTSPEDLDGENMYRCERCSAYVRARKQLSVHEVPNILTIVLKRFQSGKYGKINKCVTFPELLDMIPFVTTGTGDKPPLYMLYAVIVHLDNHNASFSGHYISYVKDLTGTWLRIDDSEVQVVQLSQVMSQGAYMLFYTRSYPRPPRVWMEKSSSNPNVSEHKSASKPMKSGQIYDFRAENRPNARDQSAFASSATDYSDANSSSEWSLFTSSDESSFTTESTRDSFSMVDYGENPNPNLNPNLDPFASIFGPYFGGGGEYNNHASSSVSCRPQTRYYVEHGNNNNNINIGNNVNGGVIRGRNVDLAEVCYVQTTGYCDV